MDIAKHPLSHFKVIEKDVLVNGKSILSDISEAIKTYRAGDYESFG
jgi:hypothetical protein